MSTIRRVRDYWNAMPCDSVRSDLKPGSLAYYEELEKMKYDLEPHIREFADFEQWRGKKVLEIGCGIGADTSSFAKAGADVTAVDLSDISIGITQHRLETLGLEGKFYRANAEYLSLYLKPEPFDLIYSYGVIHHTPYPERVFEQLLQYCHSSTELRIMMYSKWCARTLWRLFSEGHGAFWKFSEIARLNAEYQYGCPVAYHYTYKELRELLKDYNITNMQKKYIKPGILPNHLTLKLAKYLGSEILISMEPK